MGFISPKLDYCMKELFANNTILKGFISDVLDVPLEEIKSVRMANPYLWKRYRRQKQGILDVLLELNDDTKINIELQTASYKHWDKRNLFYLAKMYTDDLRVGERYENLKRCICISILDFNLTDRPGYHSVYRFRDRDGNDFSDLFEIHTIELRKKLDDGEVADWVRFFNVTSEEDLNMLKTENTGIIEAVRQLKLMNLTKALRWQYEAHMKEVRDRNARDDYVRDEGIAIGEERGIAIGTDQGMEKHLVNQITIKLHKGQTVEQIADALEETPERIRELIDKNGISK